MNFLGHVNMYESEIVSTKSNFPEGPKLEESYLSLTDLVNDIILSASLFCRKWKNAFFQRILHKSGTIINVQEFWDLHGDPFLSEVDMS